jgi:FxsC-like protein
MADTGEMNSDYLTDPRLGVFTIEIAAPGGSSADWRPFPAQELPLADCASQIIERFDFKAEVIELSADRDPDASRPGLILIDPRFMTTPGGPAALEAVAAGLPRWILPMLVVEQPDDSATAVLADQVRDILIGTSHARSALTAAHGVSSCRAFSLLVRDLVFQAEEQYIKYRSRQRYGGGAPVPAPLLSGRSGSPLPSRPDRFASAPDRSGETPDAR